MPRDARTSLWALTAADRLDRFRAGKSYADYAEDDLLRSAVERQFEIVGEALNQLSKTDAEITARIPDLRRIVAFRDILIHGYATVDNAIVWQALTHRLPTLRDALGTILGEIDQPPRER